MVVTRNKCGDSDGGREVSRRRRFILRAMSLAVRPPAERGGGQGGLLPLDGYKRDGHPVDDEVIKTAAWFNTQRKELDELVFIGVTAIPLKNRHFVCCACELSSQFTCWPFLMPP